jgi:hypothetical protein
MQRSRIEALLASFPKLADSGTQHTIAEQDNVRYVYQPLDELYMVLVTNLQSNILQDINSLHLFAQVVSSICKSLDEREILKNAFELLTAFDEIVTLGYRENLTMSQIKTFLDMESHEERIQEIIARNKELEASEERKRRAKQLEMQRKEQSRSQRAGGGMGGGMGSGSMGRSPSYPAFTPSVPTTNVADTYDSYAAEKKAASKPLALGKKGMQLGKKKQGTNLYEQVTGGMAQEEEPLVSPKPSAPAAAAPASARQSTSTDREPVHITTSETISARLDREGNVKTFEVKGEMQLKISDSSFTQVKLDLATGNTHGAQLMTHPKVDKAVFRNDKVIQLADASKGFPTNMGIGVMKWKLAPRPEDVSDPPITFRVWVEDSGNMYNITVEYELTGGDALKDVTVTIPFETDEPNVSSFDAVYEVSGDSLEWNLGTVNESNSSGSFEFEAQAGSDAEFFPMRVRFTKSTPFVDVDVSCNPFSDKGRELISPTGLVRDPPHHGPGNQLLKGNQVRGRRVRNCMSRGSEVSRLEAENENNDQHLLAFFILFTDCVFTNLRLRYSSGIISITSPSQLGLGISAHRPSHSNCTMGGHMPSPSSPSSSSSLVQPFSASISSCVNPLACATQTSISGKLPKSRCSLRLLGGCVSCSSTVSALSHSGFESVYSPRYCGGSTVSWCGIFAGR